MKNTVTRERNWSGLDIFIGCVCWGFFRLWNGVWDSTKSVLRDRWCTCFKLSLATLDFLLQIYALNNGFPEFFPILSFASKFWYSTSIEAFDLFVMFYRRFDLRLYFFFFVFLILSHCFDFLFYCCMQSCVLHFDFVVSCCSLFIIDILLRYWFVPVLIEVCCIFIKN